VQRSAEELYDMVSDVTRMGEWSPVCKSCWWDGDSLLGVGTWFTGRNELPDRTWETRSQVVVAERGHEFAFVVTSPLSGDPAVRWSYTFDPATSGTRITESWEDLPAFAASFKERYGADAQQQVRMRIETGAAGISATLAAIKIAAESAP